jgi:uncharacterized membrane protein YfcA
MFNPVVIVIAFFSAFVQTSLGFGAALVAMPLLVYSIGLSLAAPSFAIVGALAGMSLIWRYRNDFHWRDIWRLILSALFAIPIGIFLAEQIDEHVVLLFLGVITIAYALYNLLNFTMPELKDKRWAFVLGIGAGVLHGAYNTGGPPLVIYGNSQRWKPLTFKGNLQVTFLPMTSFVVLGHALSGNINSHVTGYVVMMLTGTVLGQLLGFYTERFMRPVLFRRLVLVGLLILGVSMIMG